MKRRTARLDIVPATAELVRAEINDQAALSVLLGAAVPPDWPPEMLAGALPWFLGQLEADSALSGWLAWYGTVRGEGSEPSVLAASGGFMGPPQEGRVEIGYSVLPAFQQRGYATELVADLTEWALAQPNVHRVVADVRPDNTPSVRLLRRLGFVETGAGAEPGHVRFERIREDDHW